MTFRQYHPNTTAICPAPASKFAEISCAAVIEIDDRVAAWRLGPHRINRQQSGRVPRLVGAIHCALELRAHPLLDEFMNVTGNCASDRHEIRALRVSSGSGRIAPGGRGAIATFHPTCGRRSMEIRSTDRAGYEAACSGFENGGPLASESQGSVIAFRTPSAEHA